MKTKYFLLCASACTLAIGGVVTSHVLNSDAEEIEPTQEVVDDAKLISDLFTLKNVRGKVSSLAPSSETYSSTEKGLLLYSYESGGSATYKQLLNGSTTFRSIAATLNKKTPNLTHYSYKITDLVSGESFKIHVLTNEKVTTYYVETDGKIAGEAYFSSIDGMVTHGYSKLFNNSGTYTDVTSTGFNIDSKITFNPADMSIVVEGQTKSFEVWNFKDEYIDGKAQIKQLSSFTYYQVDIVFEEIIANSKAELVLYEIGNKTFDGAILNNPTMLFADLSLKGVVGQAYHLPTPIGEKSEDTNVWVYKEGSNEEPVEIMNSVLSVSDSFIPDTVGDYYILYKGKEGELRDKISIINADELSYSFSSNVLEGSNFGYKSTITVPELIYKSKRSDKDLKSLVTIKLGEEVLVENRSTNFEFSFDKHDKNSTADVEYTFIYKCENSNIAETVTKKVLVKASNGVSYHKSYLEDYVTGLSVEIAKGSYFINGQEYTCDVEVIYPSESKVVTFNRNEFDNVSPTLKLDSNGTYTIRYHLDEMGVNFVSKFRAMPKVDELFSCVDVTTSYGTSSSSDINRGVVGSFKNDGVLTYNKVIDATTLTKDKKLISLDAQPKTPGTPEMNHIYVTVADESDPDNCFEIRLSQGSDNVSDKTFIRAQASGQRYGGYYYNSWFDIDSNIAVARWFNELSFGCESTNIDFNNFKCEVITEEVEGITKMTLKIDHNPKNLHFIQSNIIASSFKSDLADFIEEFNDQIDTRLGDGRLTKADIGQVHEPEITWQADSAHDQGGFLHEHSFTGDMDTYSFENVDYVDFYYDNEDKALYTNFWYHVAGYKTESRIVKFCDFDDPSTFGADQMWSGFKTNKVKISVSANGISDEFGDVFIREICGNKFNSELLSDDDSPIITLDDAVIPNAKVGTPFKPLDATYSDLTSAIESKEIKVTDPNGNPVELVADKFTPTVEGEYTITYIAKDSFDNEARESIKIMAKDPSYFNAFDAELNVSDGETVQYGINYEIPNPTITGGCGKYDVIKTATVKSKTGEVNNVEVNDGKIRILHSGTYTVTLKCVDYLGEEKTLTYTFNSEFSSDPIFEGNLVLPERLFNGVPYKLDSFMCKIFEREGEEQKEVNVKVRVNDANGTNTLGEDMIYVPACDETHNVAHIELFVTANSKDYVLASKDVELFDLDNTNAIIEGYFKSGSNVELEAYYGCIFLKSNDESGIIESNFVNPIPSSSVSLGFGQFIDDNTNQSLSNISSLTVTLTDFKNPNISFDVKFTQKGNGVFASLPDTSSAETKISHSFIDPNDSGDMGLSFKAESNTVVDISGNAIGRVSKCKNGQPFEGFTSEKVLISLKATGVRKDNGVSLTKLSDISLNDNRSDRNEPTLIVSSAYGGYVKENETVTLPSAIAYDILSYCEEPTLSVWNKETGEFIEDDNGLVLENVPTNISYNVTFKSYGEYSVEYKATDSAGNTAAINVYPYYVTDSEPATIVFSNELTNDTISVAKFSSINVLAYTIEDNADTSNCLVNIFVVLPTSQVITLRTDVLKLDDAGENYSVVTTMSNCVDGSYKFTGEGRYQIIYLITDSNGNICAVTKVVNVK